MQDRIRAFFAVDLAPTIKQEISQYLENIKETFSLAEARWTAPADLHITLQFLPAIKEADIPLLVEKVKNLSTLQPVIIQLGQVELFPSPVQPHVLVLDIEPKQILTNYALSLGRCITQLGYEVEKRSFRAHITLARFKNLNAIESLEFAPIDIAPILVNEITLFQSKPQSTHSCYTPLARISVGE